LRERWLPNGGIAVAEHYRKNREIIGLKAIVKFLLPGEIDAHSEKSSTAEL
jgi:hypothetical protein